MNQRSVARGAVVVIPEGAGNVKVSASPASDARVMKGVVMRSIPREMAFRSSCGFVESERQRRGRDIRGVGSKAVVLGW